MAVAGAVELVLASDVVDELSDIPDAVIGGLMPEGFGMDRTAPSLGGWIPDGLTAGGGASVEPFPLGSNTGFSPPDSLIAEFSLKLFLFSLLSKKTLEHTHTIQLFPSSNNKLNPLKRIDIPFFH